MRTITAIFSALLIVNACKNQPPEEVVFEKKIISNEANLWWARSFADINGDGLQDIVLQDNNGHGGWLGWLETGKGLDQWTKHIISDTATAGEKYASGDMAAADFDNDGDIDILGFAHPGEWGGGAVKPTSIYWFENPGWAKHYIGEVPAFVKDVEIADFNQDGKPDIVVNNFENTSLQVFTQTDQAWEEVLNITIPNLHEGMHVGDIDGDGFPDIAPNGYWLKSPGKNLSNDWELLSIDEKWHNQGGDWSRNATKVFGADLDRDGKDEVFISHSERVDYPLAWYKLTDIKNNIWEEHIIDSINACHTFQVFDFNNDGSLDILAGENQQRWGGDDDPTDPFVLYLNNGDNTFSMQLISNEGIYNGLAGDIEGDGDFDILRLPGHASETMEIWLNQTK